MRVGKGSKMEKLRLLGVGLLVISILLIGASISRAGSPESIKIGVPGPYTGAAAEKGEHLKYGIILAAEEINERGGVLGKEIELIFADTEAKADVGVSAYEKLITQDGVSFIVGEVNSHVALATMDVVARYRIPTIYAIPASDELGDKVKSDPEKYGNIFMTDVPVSLMQNGAFLWLKEIIKEGKWQPPSKTFGLIVEDTSWGRIVGEIWKAGLEEMEWENVLYEVVPFGATEYYPIITKVIAKKPALLKIELTSLPAGVAITKQMHEMGVTSLIFGGYYQKTREFPEMAGTFAEGQLNIKEAYAKWWDYRITDRFPKADPIASMYSYDALYILVTAIRRAGTLDADAVIDALLQTDYHGVFMRTVFDPVTHFAKVGKEYKLYGVAQFSEGQLWLIWPPEYAEKEVELP